MIDLHTHTVFSDGELIPAELIRRSVAHKYEAIALTDHVDRSNFDFIIPRIVSVCRHMSESSDIIAMPGVELTHVPPRDIPVLAAEARKLGAAIILVHGETIVEPVSIGTNAAAIDADIDILAHPGMITEHDVRRAAERGIYLEITTRKGHCLTNGHVAKLALACGAGLVLNTDMHSPDDMINDTIANKIVAGCGLPEGYFDVMLENSRTLLNRRMLK
ncbi:MAG: histidinol phosphate phosphatase domain-containing protein [Desulfobacterota bacterium]|nr:histidinol phosphate phosphatase domain-containing protein [Thermodesulfobacteriota bacterium]